MSLLGVPLVTRLALACLLGLRHGSEPSMDSKRRTAMDTVLKKRTDTDRLKTHNLKHIGTHAYLYTRKHTREQRTVHAHSQALYKHATRTQITLTTKLDAVLLYWVRRHKKSEHPIVATSTPLINLLTVLKTLLLRASTLNNSPYSILQ